MQYPVKSFNVPPLDGLSQEQLKAHFGLYEGYVKHVNLIMDKIAAFKAAGAEENFYPIMELRRRFSFEFNGMRLHEYYFEQFDGGHVSPDMDSSFNRIVADKYDNQDIVSHIREVAGSRGVGWVIVYADPIAMTVHTIFASEHEIGVLAGLTIVLVLDVWEHAFMIDYAPSAKSNYIDAFFKNLNWSIIEKRFETAMCTDRETIPE